MEQQRATTTASLRKKNASSSVTGSFRSSSKRTMARGTPRQFFFAGRTIAGAVRQQYGLMVVTAVGVFLLSHGIVFAEQEAARSNVFAHSCSLCPADQVLLNPSTFVQLESNANLPPATCQQVSQNIANAATSMEDCDILKDLALQFCECGTAPCSICPYGDILVNPDALVSVMDNNDLEPVPCSRLENLPLELFDDSEQECAALLELATPTCQCSSSPVPTALQTLAPTAAPYDPDATGTISPTYPGEPCEALLCVEENALMDIPVSIAGTIVTCGQLVEWSQARLLSPGVCYAAADTACGCPRPPPTMAPTSSPRPTVTAAPTFGADDDDGACQFCPIAHPDATVQLLGLDYPCRQIVREERRLEPDLCRHAQPLVERDCGCATEAPVAPPPPPPTRTIPLTPIAAPGVHPPSTGTIPLSPLAAPGVQRPMAARSPVAPPVTVNPTEQDIIFGRSWSEKAAAAPHAVHCLLLTLLFVLGA